MKTAPIILLCGQAGSGKDTAAKFITEALPKVSTIAQADPLKVLGERLFTFTQDQLYGPSASRNAPDPRYDSYEAWDLLLTKQDVINEWLRYCGITSCTREFAEWLSFLRAQTIDLGKPLTPRLMLQTLGTEFGRRIKFSIWSDIAFEKALERLTTGISNLVIITDGRFKNEVLNAKKFNSMSVLIMTPEEKSDAVENAGVKGHQSEAELKTIPLYWYDEVIVNTKRLGLENYKNKIDQFVNHHFKEFP